MTTSGSTGTTPMREAVGNITTIQQYNNTKTNKKQKKSNTNTTRGGIGAYVLYIRIDSMDASCLSPMELSLAELA